MSISADDMEASWVTTVTRFVEASPWLDDTHLPQLKALVAIAKRLDMPGDWNAALVSQFTLVQRTLASKAPGAESDEDGDDGLLDGPDTSHLPPAMFELA